MSRFFFDVMPILLTNGTGDSYFTVIWNYTFLNFSLVLVLITDVLFKKEIINFSIAFLMYVGSQKISILVQLDAANGC